MDAVVFGKTKQVEDRLIRLQNQVEMLQLQVDRTSKILTIQLETPEILPGETYRFDPQILPGIGKMILKSIYIEGVLGTRIDLELLSSRGDAPFLLYKNSVNSHILYDVVDLPYTDDDGTDALHLNLLNNGDTAHSKFRVRLSGLSSL